jgi:hypothetical protein
MGEDGHKLQKRCLPWGLSSHRRSEETGGGRGFIKLEKWGDVIYGWSLIHLPIDYSNDLRNPIFGFD